MLLKKNFINNQDLFHLIMNINFPLCHIVTFSWETKLMVLMIFFGFQYLTTVIPYDDFDGGPSTKVLLQLIESRC